MGLAEGERVEVDQLERYRIAFEDQFDDWVTYAAQARSCLQGNVDDEDIEAVIERAASAFYPDWFDGTEQENYANSLSMSAATARMTGAVDAVAEGCVLTGDLADASFRLVEQTLEFAEEVE
jgi:hypothetical protein